MLSLIQYRRQSPEIKQTYVCDTGNITADRLRGSISAALFSPRGSFGDQPADGTGAEQKWKEGGFN